MAQPERILLAGMMGSGKSSVGALLAARLGRPFVDLDAWVVEQAGRSITEIFAVEGEAGFRARERAALAGLEALPEAVVALGGGTLLDPESRARLRGMGRLICLTASPDRLARRLAAAPALERPLLAPLHPADPALEAGRRPDPPVLGATDAAATRASSTAELRRLRRGLRIKLAGILSERQPLYDALPLQVATDGRDLEAVVEAVLVLLERMGDQDPLCLPVRTPPEAQSARFGYCALIGAGLLDRLGPLMQARGLDGRVLLVSDTAVGPLHAETALAGLRAAGFAVRVATLGQGEPAKTLDSVAALYPECLAAGLDRDGIVVALGGGVVGDTAGLVAATWLRGIRLVQAPSSLLAMVDASVGGKVGVNLPAGKNLVGAFHHPALVLADTALLATLPEAERIAGLAEVVKAALIDDPGLLELLEREGVPAAGDGPAWARLVQRALAVKARLVSEDPEERGRRVLLNLGHTFGHAIEQVSAYGYRHGEAVAIGLVAAARLAERQGLAREPGLPERLERLLLRLGLPVRCPGLRPEDLLAAMAVDKKRRDGRLRFVLPRAPGDLRLLRRVDDAALASVLHERCLAAPDRDAGAAGTVDRPAPDR
ncbi:MAG: 3-dehydroquinate synthase [Caldilineae bacterium]|nr:3-dehydroquinate synthase [Caldilineae bacterium]